MQPIRLRRAIMTAALLLAPAMPALAVELEIARIFIEYNDTDNDLGFHVFLDGEDWKDLAIVNPDGDPIFLVEGDGGYADLGMTELFFEGAEPSLDDVPLEDLLALFPEGTYHFTGTTVDDEVIEGDAALSHAVPAAPEVSSRVAGKNITISWQPVPGTPPGFPDEEVNVVGYQVIVGSFQVTLPGTSTSVKLPREYAASLESGEHDFEVLAIDESGNQTIASDSFEVR